MALSPVPVTATSLPTWIRTAATVINAMLRNVTSLMRRPLSSATRDTTTGATDYLTLIDASAGAVTITLPTPESGRQLAYKRTDGSANIVTLSGPVDGAMSTSLATQWAAIQLIGGTDRWLSI